VILEKPGERDIFIPARWTMGAMNNDRVVVRMEHWQRREGGLSGFSTGQPHVLWEGLISQNRFFCEADE